MPHPGTLGQVGLSKPFEYFEHWQAEGDAKNGRNPKLRGSVQQRAVANLKAVLCMAAMVKSIYKNSPLAQGLLDSKSFGA